jgi:hypothetical protein
MPLRNGHLLENEHILPHVPPLHPLTSLLPSRILPRLTFQTPQTMAHAALQYLSSYASASDPYVVRQYTVHWRMYRPGNPATTQPGHISKTNYYLRIRLTFM